MCSGAKKAWRATQTEQLAPRNQPTRMRWIVQTLYAWPADGCQEKAWMAIA